ncbi:MAG: molybdopterin-dependent oxidoreductase [SAR202 cluster bacterium]|jgi:anaerobic dimethyl sulfoxide reductase subunit A|nr:molybdopterin-dependent oxidoreductase [SAR202 cluster bacterium]|tara:strand:+ start:569 stop:2800 length:2232 start_codon:yes stop_codon:yes gene_type:complete
MVATTIYQNPRRQETDGERIVTSTCASGCGGRCIVNAHVRDGKIVKISTQPGKWDAEMPPLFACVRGFAAEERVNHPDRLKYPMRRTGKRGSGEFERISWDEALDEVASSMLRIRKEHGSASILNASSGGAAPLLNNRNTVQRLLNMFGGCTEPWGNISRQAEAFAFQHTFGDYAGLTGPAGRDPIDYANSKMILLWGWTPGDGHFGTGTLEYLKHARKQGTRMICIDPRGSHTSATVADEHIYIKPSTDAAMLVAMAYVIVTEELQDQHFLDRYVQGFDEAHLPDGAPPGSDYRSYVLGAADGVPKTPEWAEEITGVPAAKIAELAREFATSQPAAIHCGFAPGRTAYGEQFHRAAFALAAMTGSIGVSGGNTGVSSGSTGSAGVGLSGLPTGPNPVTTKVAKAKLADLLEKGTSGGYPVDVKMIYGAFGNWLNQLPNTNKTSEAMKSDNIEFIVIHDHFMTPMAQHADIVLPASFSWERNDISTPWGIGHYAIFMKQAIEPMYECRNDIDICTDLAKRLGISGYNDKASDIEWLREFCEGTAIDDFDAFMENGLARLPPPSAPVAFADQIDNPDSNPFSTPSGKIEIYSTAIASEPDFYGLGSIPAIPKYVPPFEADLAHPLQLVTPQSKARSHSTFGNLTVLQAVDPQVVWVHTDDAVDRSISDGQQVRVFNDRGATIMPVKVTDRITRGVVSMKEGAWFSPDESGVDTGGSANVLSLDSPSPSGAQTYNTCLVEVEPVA